MCPLPTRCCRLQPSWCRWHLQNLIQLAAIPSDPITTASITPLVSLGAAEREPQHSNTACQKFMPHYQQNAVSFASLPTTLFIKAGDRIGVYFKLTNTGEAPLIKYQCHAARLRSLWQHARHSGPQHHRRRKHSLYSCSDRRRHCDGPSRIDSGITANRAAQQSWKPCAGPCHLLDVDASERYCHRVHHTSNVPTLAPGAETTFTATYQLTQNDIDAGQVLNTATASATNVLNITMTATDERNGRRTTSTCHCCRKTAVLHLGADNEASVGDLVTYTFTMRNTGNTTLNDVQLADPIARHDIDFHRV